MTGSSRTNILAIISFLSGLTALASGSFVFLLYRLDASAGRLLFLTDGILMPLRDLCVTAALLTGVLALIQIRKPEREEKGKRLAWAGILLSAGWILFGLLVGAAFFLGELLR